MNDDSKALTGWSRHQHFGFRKEWLQLYLSQPDSWKRSGSLGNRQVVSMRTWLKTLGLLDKKGKRSVLFELFHERGVDTLWLWEMVWVNVVFQFPTAAWYVQELGTGEWSTTQMRDLLLEHQPRLVPRMASQAIFELVGTLERTPIGREIGQGVVSQDRPRLVARSGLNFPSEQALRYATCRTFVQEQRSKLDLSEQVLWPWVVFGCAKEYAIERLILDDEKHFIISNGAISLKGIPGEEQPCHGFILTTSM